MSNVDLWADAVPNWVAAVSAFGALVAASVAGFYAGRAAHWTSEQAKAADKQAKAADAQVVTQVEALTLARSQAEDAMRETERQHMDALKAERRAEETRVDALAPSILATASPGRMGPDGGFGVEVQVGGGAWELLTDRREFQGSAYDVRFRQWVRITFENVSGVPARIDIADPYQGEMGYDGRPLAGGAPIWVRPGQTEEIMWKRTLSVGALADGVGGFNPHSYLFYLAFWARDVNMNVRDEYKFGGRVMDVEQDGSRVIVGSVPATGWTDRVAAVLSRSYDRLEAADRAVADAVADAAAEAAAEVK